LISAADVALPDVAARLRLLTAIAGPHRQDGSLWLTNMTGSAPESVLLRTRALDRVADVREHRSTLLGLCDFSGRSYGGWHRHMTLVAAAHCLQDHSRA